MPSVFALWSISDWLPRIWLKHFAVSKYILGGADVMLPGVNVPDEGFPEPFNEGDCVSICVPGNPAPIAVGHAAMSSRLVNAPLALKDASGVSAYASKFIFPLPSKCRQFTNVLEHWLLFQ